MEAKIYQRKSDGKWVRSIELPPDEITGKRNRKVVYGNTKNEVKEKANIILYELQTNQYEEQTKDTLIAFLDRYYNACLPKWEDTTSALYRMYIDVHFKPYFGTQKLKDIKPLTLNAFYSYKMKTSEHLPHSKKMKKPMSANSVIKLNTFLKAAFNYAIKNGLIKSNPACAVILPKKIKYEPTVYNEKQFLELLDSVTGTDDEIPIILGAGCGLRRGEVFGLFWKDVDFKKKMITIENTSVRFDKNIEKSPKTESSKRTIMAPEYVINTLEKYMKANKATISDKVITRWVPQAYSERFKRKLNQFGLEQIRFHDLRHYNAVIMLKRGITDKVAAERLGHSQVSTLRNVYQHVLQDMDTSAANQLDTMFYSKPTRATTKLKVVGK